jgi:hypothetical protein
LEQYKDEKSQSNVPIRVIGTMQDEKQAIQCSNKGHWNNTRIKKANPWLQLFITKIISNKNPRQTLSLPGIFN